jgi:hypothetical protein
MLSALEPVEGQPPRQARARALRRYFVSHAAAYVNEFRQASSGPAPEAEPPPSHVAVAPALDVPHVVAQRPDEILDAVRRREEAAQPRRQPPSLSTVSVSSSPSRTLTAASP